jgi:exodeoxyribonuclease-3
MAHDALMQPESRAAYRRILHQGWTDAIRARHPDGPVWTFWDYTAGCWQRDAGFRIDHLLLSPQAADRLLDAGVDKEYRGREKAATTRRPGFGSGLLRCRARRQSTKGPSG